MSHNPTNHPSPRTILRVYEETRRLLSQYRDECAPSYRAIVALHHHDLATGEDAEYLTASLVSGDAVAAQATTLGGDVPMEAARIIAALIQDRAKLCAPEAAQ